jgi:hypothetical protein
MFLFIIPRTPVSKRSPLRNELWELCKKSLMQQTSKNWKTIIVGDVTGEYLDPNHFIVIDFVDQPKSEKLIKANWQAFIFQILKHLYFPARLAGVFQSCG